ncbi:MAG: hypothetical protein IIY77_08815 [Lachnospiraceae bacterium]|nr:hypothetical protein [Lachnospiraceae bacterium]
MTETFREITEKEEKTVMPKNVKKKEKKKEKPTGFVGKNIRRVQIGSKGFKIAKTYVYPVIMLAFVAFAAFLGVTPKKEDE